MTSPNPKGQTRYPNEPNITKNGWSSGVPYLECAKGGTPGIWGTQVPQWSPVTECGGLKKS